VCKYLQVLFTNVFHFLHQPNLKSLYNLVFIHGMAADIPVEEAKSQLITIQKSSLQNQKCMDCNAPSPTWASPMYGSKSPPFCDCKLIKSLYVYNVPVSIVHWAFIWVLWGVLLWIDGVRNKSLEWKKAETPKRVNSSKQNSVQITNN